jgi:hypothetical protein
MRSADARAHDGPAHTKREERIHMSTAIAAQTIDFRPSELRP